LLICYSLFLYSYDIYLILLIEINDYLSFGRFVIVIYLFFG